MGILRKVCATLTAAAFVGVGALSATTSAEAAPQVVGAAQKTATAPAPVGQPPRAAAAKKATPASSTKATMAKYRLDSRCMTKGRVLCINKKTRKLVYLVNGKAVQVMDVRFGAMKTPTRNGSFKIQRKSKNHVSTLYHSKMPYAMFFSGGQAVHYSSDFRARGYNGASHGCVNVRDKNKIAWVFARVRVGDKVLVYSK